MSFTVFGFQALWSPYFFVTIIFLTTIYFFVTIKWRNYFENSTPFNRNEAMYFTLAMILLYIIKGSPIDLLGHILFSMHMVQMALLLLLVPILMIKGIPQYIWHAVLQLKIVAPIFQLLTRPLISLLLFVTLFSIYHLPVVFDTIKMNSWLHSLFTFVLFIASVCMYWPLLQSTEGQQEMKNLHKLGYIAGNAVLITPACALIIFASVPMYATYTEADSWLQAMALCVPAETLATLTLSGPELFSNMSPLSDQQVGGVLMKIIQEIIFGVILFQVFTKWWKNERANDEEITAQALHDFQHKNKLS